VLLQNDRIRVVIGGIEFRGMPQWSDEDGFSAELIGVLTSSDFEAPARLSSMLRVTINEAERAILVHPYVATSGSMSFKSDAPATTDVTLRAQGIIRDLPRDEGERQRSPWSGVFCLHWPDNNNAPVTRAADPAADPG
jgi:hypothetical protein